MTQLLSAYILLFNEYNEKKASAQKDILIRILDDGVKKLNEAQKSLLASSQSFNNASGKLLALDSQLTNDFSEKAVISRHRWIKFVRKLMPVLQPA